MKWFKQKGAQAPQRCLWLTQGTGMPLPRSLRSPKAILMGWDRFTESVIKAAKGQKAIVEPSYVYLPGIDGGDAISKETGVDYFSVPIELGVSPDLGWTLCVCWARSSRRVPRRPKTCCLPSAQRRSNSSRPARQGWGEALRKGFSSLPSLRRQSE